MLRFSLQISYFIIGLYKPAVILIDPAILSNEFLLESNQANQDIRDTLQSSQQELPCLYPEPLIDPHGMFNNNHPFLGLINENRPAIYHQCSEPSQEVHPGNNAESNKSSPQGPQQHYNSSANQTKQRKQPSTRLDKYKRQRNK